ncbi:hypothetical protein LCGC14_1134760 [marine sediment metagenome]|uniref:Uncharacterized protein n=1 Tax=marine sediment metagenome TaxID=412755 RepID=A0A0F9MMY9_9ZZZZ
MAVKAYGISATAHDDWAGVAIYSSGNYILPTVKNGKRYECTTPGISGSTEPLWRTTVGETFSDGSAVWTCRDLSPAPSALSVELDSGGKGGYSLKDVWMKSSGSVTFKVYGSHEGVDGTWREIDSENVNNSERFNQYVTAYRFLRVSTPSVASNEIEIVAG